MADPVLIVRANEIISNDGTHEGHGPDNPDSGETSAFALELAAELGRLGIEAVAERMEDD